MPELSDRFLIENCCALKEASAPDFITGKTKERLFSLLNALDSDGNIKSDSFDEHHDLWKEMLSDAITFLKNKDKREFKDKNAKPERDLVAFGVNDLYGYYKEYRDFEALLYGADKFYRDHFAHVFRVWFIGNWIIEKFKYSIAWDYNELVKDDKSLEISKEEVLAIWCIIALAHDLGYPLDKVDKIQNKINSMMTYFGGVTYGVNDFQIPSHHHFINDFILKFIASKLIKTDKVQYKPVVRSKCHLIQKLNTSKRIKTDKDQYKTAVQSKYYLKFSKSFEKYNHGIITCILLMKNLIYFLESDMDLKEPFSEPEDARQYYIRREILRAIAGHTSTDIYHLFPNALSFILILADELQVWKRPTFQELKSERQRLEINSYIDIFEKENISLRLEINEKKPTNKDINGGEKYFEILCGKWMKWLRGALDAGKRPFSFAIKGTIQSKGKPTKEICFKNEPLNNFSYSVDGKPVDDFVSVILSE